MWHSNILYDIINEVLSNRITQYNISRSNRNTTSGKSIGEEQTNNIEYIEQNEQKELK